MGPEQRCEGRRFQRSCNILEPGLNFGEVRKALRPLAGIQPEFAPIERMRTQAQRDAADRGSVGAETASAQKFAKLALSLAPRTAGARAAACRPLRRHSRRPLRLGVVRPSRRRRRHPRRCARPDLQRVAHRRMQVPVLRSRTIRPGAAASSWRKPRSTRSAARRWKICATTRFTPQPAAGWGQPPLKPSAHHLRAIAAMPGAEFESATDANLAGDRYAERHREIAREAGVAFIRRRPPDNQDWNDVIKPKPQGDLQ